MASERAGGDRDRLDTPAAHVVDPGASPGPAEAHLAARATPSSNADAARGAAMRGASHQVDLPALAEHGDVRPVAVLLAGHAPAPRARALLRLARLAEQRDP